MNVLAFGEILWDVINGEEHLGGAPFNFAAHAARCGSHSSIVSRLGQDQRGIKAFDQCTSLGVGNSFIQWDSKHPTGTVDVVLDAGQPDYTINTDAAYDFIDISPELETAAKDQFDVLYFGSLVQRSPAPVRTLDYILDKFSFKHVFYDVNLRKNCYSSSIISSSLQRATILKLNTDEVPVIAELLFQEKMTVDGFCKAVTNAYSRIRIIVVTAADKGCFVFEGTSLEHIPGKKVVVADAVGAGDAFSAAFMHQISRGKSPVASATAANHLGGYVASRHGAIPDYSDEIRALLL